MWRTQDTATPSTSGVLNQSAHLLGFESVAFFCARCVDFIYLFIYYHFIIIFRFIIYLFFLPCGCLSSQNRKTCRRHV